MGLRAGLNTYLNARAALTALVSDRIGPPPAEQGDDKYPAVTYQIISYPNVHSLQGVSQLAYPRVQITGWARTVVGADALRDVLVDALDGYAGAMGSVAVQCCLKLDERDLFDTVAISPGNRQARIYGKALDFQIWHTEAAPTFA